MIITVFEKYNSPNKPFLIEADKMLGYIGSGRRKKEILEIRSLEGDKKAQNELKKLLPCICWSGEFSYRNDVSLIKHSGLAIMDIDELTEQGIDVHEKKKEISKMDFVYSIFLSPRGNGLKVLVRIPPVADLHRWYYTALLDLFPNTDTTSINESRICFDSYDPDIYINKNAVEFTEKKKPLDFVSKDKSDKPKFKKDALINNYSRAERALNMVRNAMDGEKHSMLIKASYLMGGYISGGIISESEGQRLLEQEIQNKDIDSLQDAIKTIKSGISKGLSEPIEAMQYENYIHKPVTKPKTSKTEPSIEVDEENLTFVADKEEIETVLNQWRTKTFPMGITTGFPSLDAYFLFKRGNFNVINGFDNVGKSTVIWYLSLLSAMYHGWKWIILSSENKNGTVVKRLIEFYWSEPIDEMNELKFKQAKEFIEKHFTIIKNDTMYNFKDVLLMTSTLLKKQKYDGLVIDPYNALKIDIADESKINTHEYHYEAASEMQQYAKINDICIYLNCHVITKAMRERTAPHKADTEGGGKFANKADDFLTIHREVQNKELWMDTQIHTRKIKEVETGGSYTPLESPFIMTLVGGCGFVDSSGYNPVWRYHNNRVQQTELPMRKLTPISLLAERIEQRNETNEDDYYGEAPF